VNANPTTDKDPNDPAPRILGELLFGNRGVGSVTEAEWLGLVNGIAAGDQLALRSLYGRMYRLVFTTVLRISKSRETAEELTVDVFHEVWRRASSYDPASGTVVGWIMNQARSRAIDRQRFEHRKKRTNPHPEDPASDRAEDRSAQALTAQDQERVLRRALVALTSAERQVIETAFLSECTYVETAARLDQPLGTVKTRIRSGLMKLRRALAADSEES
jgi:RNA polymerase sigma-70 factor (ECF subfamily)